MTQYHQYLDNEFAADSLEARDLRHLLHPTTNLADLHKTGPTVHVRAEGAYMWDNHGKQYLEGMAGLWCTALGYGVEELAQVAEKALRELSYSQLFAGFTHEASIRLAEMLVEMVPFDASRVFFGLSGSDANDTQIKIQWLYNNTIGKPEKKKIISRQKGYHGVTLGAGSLTGLAPFHADFDLPLPQFRHTASPHFYREGLPGETESEFTDRIVRELEELILEEGPETVAAFVAEPIMGAGGVIVPPETYYTKVQAVLNQYDIHFIADEVICGFGRTGNAFGCETMNINPTTMSIAKALSSAYLPISGVIIPEFIYAALHEASKKNGTFGHGFTYSGHPVCTAVAVRNLELMEEMKLFDHVAQLTPEFEGRLAQLNSHPLVGETRGRGFIGAFELVHDKEHKTPFKATDGVGVQCMKACADHGLILRSLGDTLAICPPLILTSNQIHELFDKVELALADTLNYVKALPN
ncbi:MAG: aminotransferase [Gammaproteobacteria bacterium]|nr:aminotransferase [Gammaproteobacteria bacterium]